MKTGKQLVDEARARVREVTAQDVMKRQRRGEPMTLLDVRDVNEVNLGKIPDAIHVSRGTLEGKIEALIPRDADVVVYCASGNRSAFAADTLQQMGYTRVASLAGGFRAWSDAGGPVE